MRKLQDKIKILEQALQYYGNIEHYGDRGEYWKIVIDEGATARKALEDAKNLSSTESGEEFGNDR